MASHVIVHKREKRVRPKRGWFANVEIPFAAVAGSVHVQPRFYSFSRQLDLLNIIIFGDTSCRLAAWLQVCPLCQAEYDNVTRRENNRTAKNRDW